MKVGVYVKYIVNLLLYFAFEIRCSGYAKTLCVDQFLFVLLVLLYHSYFSRFFFFSCVPHFSVIVKCSELLKALYKFPLL